MKTYIVTYRYITEDRFTIEANSKKEAIEKAYETNEYESIVIRSFSYKAQQKKESEK